MTDPRFFGFGSLVNTATHSYPVVHTAHLQGWERVWVQRPEHPVTFLSCRPAAGVTIAGLICDMPGGDWAALDAREAGYTRHDVTGPLGAARPTAVYTTPGHPPASDPAKPILLSYIDVVVQGFAARFGAEGVAAFFETTAGWNVPVLDDRAAPRYPRAQVLSSGKRAQVDAQLAALQAEITPA